MEESSEGDFPELEGFPGYYAENDEDVATRNTKSVDQIFSDKIASADVASAEEKRRKRMMQYRLFLQ